MERGHGGQTMRDVEQGIHVRREGGRNGSRAKDTNPTSREAGRSRALCKEEERRGGGEQAGEPSPKKQGR